MTGSKPGSQAKPLLPHFCKQVYMKTVVEFYTLSGKIPRVSMIGWLKSFIMITTHLSYLFLAKFYLRSNRSDCTPSIFFQIFVHFSKVKFHENRIIIMILENSLQKAEKGQYQARVKYKTWLEVTCYLHPCEIQQIFTSQLTHSKNSLISFKTF